MGAPLPKLFVKSAPGRRNKHPETMRLIAEGGELVADNSFWRRRLLDGDVVEVAAPVEAPPVESKPQPKLKASKSLPEQQE